MGCHQCTSNRRPGWETGKKKISFIAPTLHYSLNFVPQSAYLNNLDSEDIKTLYKTVLSPFQLKVISCSNLKSLDTTLSSESKENSFESVPPDFQAELTSAAQIWPLDISNSIFVFVNAGKNIKIKTLMTGFERTPYAHGLFEFDVNFQNSSLAQIQVEFVTSTRNNHIFFGPKLNKLKGSEGKETLFRDKSLSEILTKLHNLVKIDTFWEEELDPDFLGLDDQQKHRLNRARKNIVKCNTIQYAMLDQIKNPVPWLRDLIHTYFYLKKDIILKECRKWLLAAQTDDAIYENLSDFGEKEFITEFENGGYFRKLSSLIKELETEISRIKIHIDSPVLEALGQTDKEIESERESPRSFGTEIDLELDSSEFKILPQS